MALQIESMNAYSGHICSFKIPPIFTIWEKTTTKFATIVESSNIMDNTNYLVNFFKRIQADPRISITHIGIFAALNYYRYQHNFGSEFRAFSKEIMRIAKISSSSTYHKCILELHEYGYLIYKSSFSKTIASNIHLPVKQDLIIKQ